MDDDLNTADAISVIFEMVTAVNKAITAESGTAASVIKTAAELIRELGGVLGLLPEEKEETLPADIQEMLEERAKARSEKNWTVSDALRDALKEKGYAVKDTPQGQQLTRI